MFFLAFLSASSTLPPRSSSLVKSAPPFPCSCNARSGDSPGCVENPSCVVGVGFYCLLLSPGGKTFSADWTPPTPCSALINFGCLFRSARPCTWHVFSLSLGEDRLGDSLIARSFEHHFARLLRESPTNLSLTLSLPPCQGFRFFLLSSPLLFDGVVAAYFF